MPIRILFVIFLLVSFNDYSQVDTFDSSKCQQYKTLGDKFFANNDYSQAFFNLFECERYCNDLDKAFYDKLITSLKNTITNCKDAETKSSYINTLVDVYNNSENKGYYDESNDLIRAAFVLKSTNINLKKVDELFVRAKSNIHIVFSETQLVLYFANIYNLYLGEKNDNKPILKRRIIKEYYDLSNFAIQENMSNHTKTNLSIYYNNVIKDSSDILPEMAFYLKTLSKNEKEKLVELNNLKTILENKKCQTNPYYNTVIDSLILIEPTLDLYMSSAKYLSYTNNYSKEFSALYFAKKIATEESTKEEIDYLMAKSLFNDGNYTESYKIAIEVQGIYFNDACIIASQSVSRNIESCGNNTTEQKLNLYYANALLGKVKNPDEVVRKLITDNISNFPNSDELSSLNLNIGQKIALKCWGIQIEIPK